MSKINNVIDISPYIFNKSFHNVLMSIEALNPSILQDYCVFSLGTAQGYYRLHQSNKGLQLVLKIEKLIQTMPDSAVSVKNLALLFNSIFQYGNSSFLAEEPATDCIRLNHIKNLLCIINKIVYNSNLKKYFKNIHKFCNNKKSKNKLEYFKRYSNDINSIIKTYLIQSNFISLSGTGKTDKVGVILKQYVAPNLIQLYDMQTKLNYNMATYLTYLFEVLHNNLSKDEIGIALALIMVHKESENKIAIKNGDSLVTLHFETWFSMMFCFLDAIAEPWLGTNFFMPSGSYFSMMSKLSKLNAKM